MTIRAAARELGVSESTIRRWVQNGAPCIRQGESGRGRGALVHVSDLERRRRGGLKPDRVLDRVAEAMLEAYRCEANQGLPAHRLFPAMPKEGKAAMLYAYAYHRVHLKLTGMPPDDNALPEPIEQLLRIVRTAHE